MAGMGGPEVGRVHIRVVPDFTYFRRIMKAVLQEFDNKEITIKVKADASQLSSLKTELNDLAKNAKAATRDVSKELSRGVRKASAKAGKEAEIKPFVTNQERYKRRMQSDFNKMMDAIEVRLNFKSADDKQLRIYWDKAAADFQRQLGKLKPDMDIRAFAAQAAWISATFKKLKQESELLRQTTSQSINATVVSKGELQDGLNKIREQVAETQRLARAAADARVNFDKIFLSAPKGAQKGAFREYLYGYRDLEGQTLRLSKLTDRLRMHGGLIGGILGGAGAIAGAKEALGLIGQAGKSVTKLGGIVSKFIPSFGTGFNLAAYALIASLIMPAIALVSGLITAAPAALAAIAVPITAIALGLDGIKKAAEVAKGAFETMRTEISAVFEKGMVPGFSVLRDTIIPGLTGSFKGVATSLSNLFNEFTANIGSETNMGFLNNIIENTGIAAQRAVPGVKNFTDGILKLVSTLSNKFPGLSDAFNRAAESFVGWVDKITTVDATGTSQLDRAMKTLGETLSGLGGIISDLFANGFNNLSNPGFGSSMKSFVEDIRSLVSEVLPALAKSFEVIATALRPIADVVSLISNLVGGFNNLTSIDIGGIKEPKINAFDRVKFMYNAVFNKEEAQRQAAQWMIDSLGAAQAAAPKAAASAGAAAAQSYSEAVNAVMSNNQQMFAVQPWALGATDINSQVQNQLTTQATAAIDGARQALAPLQAGLQTDINNALLPLGDIAGRITAAFGGVPELINGALGQVAGIVSQSLSGVKGAAETSMAGLNEAVVAACAMALLTAENQAPLIVGPFKALGGQMEAVGADIMRGLEAGIRNNVGLAKDAATRAAGEVLQAARDAVHSKSPSRDFMDLGKDINAGLGIGITDSVSGPLGAIREVMQAIKDVFGSAEGLNLNFYMGGAQEAMSSMATSSKEFRSNMVEAGTTAATSSQSLTQTAADVEDLKRQKAENAVKIADLQQAKNATQDKAAKQAYQAEIDSLQVQQKRLDLLKTENTLQEDRKTAIQKLSDTIATNIVDMIKMPGDFAKATVNAAAQDLGISGSGAIPTVANWALDAGTNFIFNVNNMDDAIQGQQAQQRRQAIGITG